MRSWRFPISDSPVQPKFGLLKPHSGQSMIIKTGQNLHQSRHREVIGKEEGAPCPGERRQQSMGGHRLDRRREKAPCISAASRRRLTRSRRELEHYLQADALQASMRGKLWHTPPYECLQRPFPTQWARKVD